MTEERRARLAEIIAELKCQCDGAGEWPPVDVIATHVLAVLAEVARLEARVKELEEKITVMRYDEQQELIKALREKLAAVVARIKFLEQQIEEHHAPWCDTYKQEGDYGYSGKGCNCFDPKV